MSEKQLLCDQSIEPTDEIIAEGLGALNSVYVKFIEGLKDYGITLMDWRFYNDAKAWLTKGEYKWTGARGGQKVTPIFWLSIWEDPSRTGGFFRISFFFSADIADQLQNLPLSRETKELIKNANPMGKTMRLIPVVMDINSAEQLSDVYSIAQFRKSQKNN